MNTMKTTILRFLINTLTSARRRAAKLSKQLRFLFSRCLRALRRRLPHRRPRAKAMPLIIQVTYVTPHIRVIRITHVPRTSLMR